METALTRLKAVARLRGYPDDDVSVRRLLAYLVALCEFKPSLNLTAARSLEEAAEVLAVTALVVVRAWDGPTPPRRAVDLGSGNGFPGVAVAVAWPDCRVLLVERRAKKARAIESCLRTAGIRNAEPVACDGRELLREVPDVAGRVDLVTARAVGTLEEVTRIAAPWLAPGGRIVHWKGESLDEAERAAGRAAALAAGLSPPLEIAFGPPPPGPARLVIVERPGGK
jgi:16S rRNA (guanine527-N7)-methyltransferase